MSKSNPFKWRHYAANIILRCVRWYCSYPLSYRQVAEIVNERGLEVHYTTVFRWVQEYGPELDRRCRPHLCPTNDSWRVAETYMEVKGKWKYLYRAVDSAGNTLDFLLSAKRDAAAAVFSQSTEGRSSSRAASDYCGQECGVSKSYR